MQNNTNANNTPGIYKLTETNIRKITDIALQINRTPVGQDKQPHGEIGKQHKCPTCNYNGAEARQVVSRRQMKTQRKIQWRKEEEHGWKCERNKLMQIPPAKNQEGNILNTSAGTRRRKKHSYTIND